MKVVFLCGSHGRHAFLARCLAKSGFLAGLIVEDRGEMLPPSPAGLPAATARLYKKHFTDRLAAENLFFGEPAWPEVPRREVTAAELNGASTAGFINALSPDALLSYGVHILSPDFLRAVPARYKWNVHGGLSPWYRGAITHFWPSYLLEPQMTGMTVHELTEAIDGGAVIHQTVAALVRGDGIHDLSCRAVLSLGAELGGLFAYARNNPVTGHPQKTTGRLWRSKDWRPEHLHLIYDHYNNRVVDFYLDGAFAQNPPQTRRQPI